MQGKIDPALVRLQLLVARAGIELGARLVEGGRARVAGAGNVQHREVEWNAKQVVAQRADDEFVDLVANLAGRAANDGARCFIGGAAGIEQDRIEEGLDQANIIHRAVRVHPGDVFVQHRVAEAVDDVGELGDNRGIDLGVVGPEQVDQGLHLAGEFLEHQMLILHLGAELGGLEQALAVPLVLLDPVREVGTGHDPLACECRVAARKHCPHQILRLIDEMVVL